MKLLDWFIGTSKLKKLERKRVWITKEEAIRQLDVYTPEGVFSHKYYYNHWGGSFNIYGGFLRVTDTDGKFIAYKLEDVKL